jgi:NYN domain
MRIGAVFLDAGYLYAAGSDLLFGEVHRRGSLGFGEPAAFLSAVADAARGCCDGEELRVLRTYWYDGALNGVPSGAQAAMGELPRVKLRLGRLTGTGQKGVDGLIILDLVTLALNRVIDTAIVFSGDEDLREAIVHVQGYGVTVILVGLPQTARQGQSSLLIRDADHHLVLPTDLVARHLTLDEPAEPTPWVFGADGPAATAQDETAILELAREVVYDARFAERRDLLDPDQDDRLTRTADRLLVGRLADRTGAFPVDPVALRSARAVCLLVAAQRWPVDGGDPAP